MIEIAGIIYAIGKDIWSHTKKSITPVPKLVNGTYIKDSGLQSKWEEQGYVLRGVVPKNIASLKLQGWDYMYAYDENKKEVFYLQLSGGTVYMGKKNEKKE